MTTKRIILGIESSCDDTSAAIVSDGLLLSNVIASQQVHENYGGVVPELASRAHQQNILPVVSEALRQADIGKEEIKAISYTRGPGLLGSLLVGTSFAKGMAIGLDIPLIDVNHLNAHVMSLFIREDENEKIPSFPFMCLLISGGNSQIVMAESPVKMSIIGKTIDDAAGEAFDKCAKVMGLPYPGGPHIDKLAKEGDPNSFQFSKPHIQGLDYSFSGLKTSFLYLLRDRIKEDENFIEKSKCDLAASLQKAIVDILFEKLRMAVKKYQPSNVGIAGGVSANSAIREAFEIFCHKMKVTPWIPQRKFTTDNAAMVATAGYYKFLEHDFSDLSLPPFSKMTI